MRPDVVTFWHGPLDALRCLCLRSQIAAGHQVTVYSFYPLSGLPDGVGNAEAEAILPHSFAERLRPQPADGTWSDWTIVQFADFFRIQLMAGRTGSHAAGSVPHLWLDTDVLLLKPVELDPAKPYFAWERRRRLGNSVLYLPTNDPIVLAFERLMAQDELTPDWLTLSHRLSFALRKLRGASHRVSDVRAAIFGPAALTALARRANELHHALPGKSFYAVHDRPKLFFERSDFSGLLVDPDIKGFHLSPKAHGKTAPVPGSLHAWATEKFSRPPS